MKSFSSTSFSGSSSEVLEQAAAVVRKNPQALFTDFQWFLYKSRNTVFFTAYSEDAYTRESLHKKVAEMVSLAPQLTHGFMGARPGQAFPQQILEAITSVETVDSFDGYPDKWLDAGLDVFSDPKLPLFRVKGLVRRGGPDAEGRASMFLFRCSHALMEGSDSALLTRSQHAGHGTMSNRKNRVPFKERLKFNLVGALSGTIQMILAHTSNQTPRDIGFKTLALQRQQVRRVAQKLGVSQRALMFSLVMQALKAGGTINPNVVSAAYTMLDTHRKDADDDFFRVHTIMCKFGVMDDFVEFVRTVDRTVHEIESKDASRFQYILNATFSNHRRWARVFPFLYGPKFFRYNGRNDLVLTLIPPHRLYGDLSKGLREPIHAGSWHPSSNLITFVPAREYATLNFSMEKRLLPFVEQVQVQLDALDAMPAPPPAAAAIPAAATAGEA